MSSITSSQTLFVNTGYCRGTTSSFRLDIPDGLITCDGISQEIQITVLNVNIFASWYSVNAGYNNLTVVQNAGNTVCVIPPGNYNYLHLAFQKYAERKRTAFLL